MVYSTSGLASASMGIMSNLAEFVHVPKDLIITAFQAGSGTMNLVNPASAIMLGVLGIAHIEFITWVKFTAKLLGIIFIVVCLVLITAMVFN